MTGPIKTAEEVLTDYFPELDTQDKTHWDLRLMHPDEIKSFELFCQIQRATKHDKNLADLYNQLVAYYHLLK
jgi:hypothetical protein